MGGNEMRIDQALNLVDMYPLYVNSIIDIYIVLC